jgi:hypothetical protein
MQRQRFYKANLQPFYRVKQKQEPQGEYEGYAIYPVFRQPISTERKNVLFGELLIPYYIEYYLDSEMLDSNPSS